VVLRVRHAFGVPGVRVPRQLFSGTAPLARSRHRGGVLAVLAGSTAIFFNRPEESSRAERNFRVTKGGPR